MKRRCVSSNLAEAFDIFGQGEDLGSCGGVSWCDLLDNLDDLSDCVNLGLGRLCLRCLLRLMCLNPFCGDRVDDVSLDLDWESVEPQSFSFSEKRPFIGTVFSGNQEI